MSLNYNKVILAGRLTASPELKQTPNGVAVTSFSIAVSRQYQKDQTDFIDCVAWRQTAEFIAKYFVKGAAICIEGSIQRRSYEKDGQKRYITEILVDEARFVESKQNASQQQETAHFSTNEQNGQKPTYNTNAQNTPQISNQTPSQSREPSKTSRAPSYGTAQQFAEYYERTQSPQDPIQSTPPTPFSESFFDVTDDDGLPF